MIEALRTPPAAVGDLERRVQDLYDFVTIMAREVSTALSSDSLYDQLVAVAKEIKSGGDTSALTKAFVEVTGDATTSLNISAPRINLSGYVKFSGLADGTTVIDGGCLRTGVIEAMEYRSSGVAALPLERTFRASFGAGTNPMTITYFPTSWYNYEYLLPRGVSVTVSGLTAESELYLFAESERPTESGTYNNSGRYTGATSYTVTIPDGVDEPCYMVVHRQNAVQPTATTYAIHLEPDGTATFLKGRIGGWNISDSGLVGYGTSPTEKAEITPTSISLGLGGAPNFAVDCERSDNATITITSDALDTENYPGIQIGHTAGTLYGNWIMGTENGTVAGDNTRLLGTWIVKDNDADVDWRIGTDGIYYRFTDDEDADYESLGQFVRDHY